MRKANRKIIILGGGDHSKVIQNIITRDYPELKICGYIDKQNRNLQIEYLGTEEDMTKFSPQEYSLVMAIGQLDIGMQRKRLVERILSMGFSFLKIISKKSTISSSSKIGLGTVVLDHVVINVNAIIGGFCIINTGAIVEHDCIIGDFVHLAPRATLSGGVKIGNHCFIGAGSVFKHYVSICDNVIVGAGGVVVKDISLPGTYVGVPVRKIK
ncbi:MAG: NeuD/PglB/VioB family sugar acetyltransferase [Candidatus Calescibacterium sp.]|nr:NeuD/PglB/VioB family sugar acetyltransferase [Candidatus Calescibacterium sp.]MCX7972253.1 NeuD/PglB/VioB family sugar acetyltransferase [bacterium]MDW8195145.1 NeuD/PglB/VioB family sugar acetyltransferase [Candidatus Calescibacterium sp.]